MVATVLAGPGAWAAVTSSNPSASTTYTGCLGNTSGSIYDVKQGSTPLAACTTKDKQIKLSAGDITGVTAGPGLTGGATKGSATLALDPADALPSGCAPGTSLVRGADNNWNCGDGLSKRFSYGAIPSGTSQTVTLGNFGLRLSCTTALSVLLVDNTLGDAGTINAIVGPLNSPASDVGAGVAAGTQYELASDTGGTATFVWDAGVGSVVTGTVTWYLTQAGGSCQFDGDMTLSNF
jgi:hypothetical protein